jgi:hypothetical protein
MNKIVNGELVPMTPEEIAEWEASQQPIVEQLPDATLVLSTVFDSQPAELRAMFAPLRAAVNLELELGHYNVVRLIIQGATVPEELEPLRQQLLDLLEGY